MTIATPPTCISFASSKGGVGKSTCCVALAGALAHHGHSVHIVDFDQTETLHRWYSANDNARQIPNLTLEKGPPDADIVPFLRNLFHTKSGFVLIDLAGSLTRHMIQLAAFASLTITPAKLSEPDVLEALKLHEQLRQISAQANKPIRHRVLINGRTGILSNVQEHILANIDAGPLHRFDRMMYDRAPYQELFLTGQPPHFNVDQKRPSTQKAIEELEYILQEVFDALADHQQKAAA